MTGKRPTIAFVPREVFSQTRMALDALYARTDHPFDLVCVDGNSPPDVAAYLEEMAREKGFALLRSDQYLTPNQARNLALNFARHHHSPDYIVFVDNDVLVAPGWLGALLRCAEETGATAVGPAYFEGLPECTKLHMLGGTCRIETDHEGRRTYVEQHDHAHRPIGDLAAPPVRRETELIEFHVVLVRMDFFESAGPLDEGLLCHSEHGDLSMTIRQSGGRIWIEPEARITYVPPARLDKADREFFFLRWSEAWSDANHYQFTSKWDLQRPTAEEHKDWIRRHRKLGHRYRGVLRKFLGKKLARSIEKRAIEPFLPALNRRIYPADRYGRPSKPKIRIIGGPGTGNPMVESCGAS